MPQAKKLGFQATWSMAVGGMVGGGIFSTLGVVIAIAGPLAWLSFLVAGAIAFVAGYSYSKLAEHHDRGGGAFTFLREERQPGFAGNLAWVLILGYVLTDAVYAFTFGEYLNHVLPFGPLGARVAAVSILVVFVVLNLRGTNTTGGVEVLLVWFKLAVLVGMSAVGIAHWNPELLSRGIAPASWADAAFGAASVFMAYEGFQLLTYDYDEIEDAPRTLHRAVLSAIVVVILLYVLVALGTSMLIGADQVVAHQEVALALAGRQVLGGVGVGIVTFAAAFSTGSAINATLFATARLTRDVAEAGELPAFFCHRNRHGVPDRAVLTLGLVAALLAAIGSLSDLVETASLAFLFTFAVVSALAFIGRAGSRLLTGTGALAATAAVAALTLRLSRATPVALGVFGAAVAATIVIRPLIVRRFGSSD